MFCSCSVLLLCLFALCCAYLLLCLGVETLCGYGNYKVCVQTNELEYYRYAGEWGLLLLHIVPGIDKLVEFLESKEFSGKWKMRKDRKRGNRYSTLKWLFLIQLSGKYLSLGPLLSLLCGSMGQRGSSQSNCPLMSFTYSSMHWLNLSC